MKFNIINDIRLDILEDHFRYIGIDKYITVYTTLDIISENDKNALKIKNSSPFYLCLKQHKDYSLYFTVRDKKFYEMIKKRYGNVDYIEISTIKNYHNMSVFKIEIAFNITEEYLRAGYNISVLKNIIGLEKLYGTQLHLDKICINSSSNIIANLLLSESLRDGKIERFYVNIKYRENKKDHLLFEKYIKEKLGSTVQQWTKSGDDYCILAKEHQGMNVYFNIKEFQEIYSDDIEMVDVFLGRESYF